MTKKRPRKSHSMIRTGSVRIIAGQLRGSLLRVLDRPGLRPTADRVRETLFNWLQTQVPGARCLDLFAGTGALGVEALSRGARFVQFVETDPSVAAALKANLARLKQTKAEVLVRDALQVLKTLRTLGRENSLALEHHLSDREHSTQSPVAKNTQDYGTIDIVFVDPPFANQLWDSVCSALESTDVLSPEAWIYLESPQGQALTIPPTWQLWRETRAGEVNAQLYRREATIR